jgi:hypothetical protein
LMKSEVESVSSSPLKPLPPTISLESTRFPQRSPPPK